MKNFKIDATDYKTNEIFKFVRQALGLTQKQMAEGIKISKSSVERYERGLDNYTFETIVKVAKKYNLKITIELNDKNNSK